MTIQEDGGTGGTPGRARSTGVLTSPEVLGKLGIAALAPGLWRLALPFPSPLGYSFSYFLRGDEGLVVVDLGWDTDAGWDLFRSGLIRAGASIDEIVGVVVTHAHPDHYGLARRLREVSDAWIGLHPGEHPAITRDAAARSARVADLENWLVACGVPPAERDDVMSDRERLAAEFAGTWPDLKILDDDVVPGTGGGLVAVHTPGHTPGHLCFHDRERRVLFTGDHVLPRVTANVSLRPTSDADPLLDYQHSVERVRAFGDDLALPGHEWSFDRLGARLEQLQAHHENRLAEIERTVGPDGSTVWEVAQAVTWARSFGSLNPRAVRSALGETGAHLVRLADEGRLVRRSGVPDRWDRP